MQSDGSTSTFNYYTRLDNNSTLTVGNDVILTGAGAPNVILLQLNNNSTLQLAGNFVRDVSPNDFGHVEGVDATTTIEYNGSTAQIFGDDDGGGSDGIDYQLVVINNTFGTEPQLSMEDDVTLTNSITFTDGVLETTSTELLTMADGAVASSGNAGSYVSGPMQKTGDDTFVFPVGKGGVWARIAISDLQNTPLTTDQFTAEYFNASHSETFYSPGDYAGTTGGLYNVSDIEYWELSRDNGSSQPKVTLHWESNTASGITDTADLTVAHYLGATTWADEGGDASGVLAAGSVTSQNNVTTFSPFTFGSTILASNPLPIELINFDAVSDAQVVHASWTTLSEINNDYFTLERSKDGIHFETVKIVDGAGNSNRKLDYSDIDQDPYDGLSYYRLMQTDYDGSFTYSEKIAVIFGNMDFPIVYPNPTSDVFNFSRPISGTIYSASFQKIETIVDKNKLSVTKYAKGVYFIRLSSGGVIRLMVN
jgi:hypothetical protein